jgi:hypothetical protein
MAQVAPASSLSGVSGVSKADAARMVAAIGGDPGFVGELQVS